MLAARGEWDSGSAAPGLSTGTTRSSSSPTRTAAGRAAAFDKWRDRPARVAEATGFTDDDKPDEVDEALYVLKHSRGAPPEVVTALVQRFVPT
jgi:hypothetical protein